MNLSLVAIVGRPNVGKSSLFNRLVGKPISIVDPTAGVTRDRILHEVRRDGFRFDLVDTGGIGIVDEAKLEADIELQIMRAIDNADRIVFLCDGRDGVAALDERIAQLLRPHKDRVVLAVNKIDHENMEGDIYEFAKLGVGEPHAVSAEQVLGLPDLLELVAEGDDNFLDTTDEENYYDSDAIRICFAGRRNVGKSSLTNALCGEDRVIVADHPGTTRDAIDIPLTTDDGNFLLIDTAGLRRKKQLRQDLEFYAACRTERGIRRADVIMLVVDASDDIGIVDKKLAHYCESEGKPTVLVVNKWDLAKGTGATQEKFIEWLRIQLPGVRYAPVVFTCALTGKNMDRVLKISQELFEENQMRANTAELNSLLERAVQRRRPRRIGPNETKLYYMTQAQSSPPTFLIFVNRTDWIESGYSRYLENFFRKYLPFSRVPYRIVFKARSSQYHDHADERTTTLARTKGERNARLLVPKAKRVTASPAEVNKAKQAIKAGGKKRSKQASKKKRQR